MDYRPEHLPETGKWTNETTGRIARDMMDWMITTYAESQEPIEGKEAFAKEIERYVNGWIADVKQDAQEYIGIAGAVVVGWALEYIEPVDWTNLADEYYETYREARDAAQEA